nr:hypothetical protein [Actinomycetota bacterium]
MALTVGEIRAIITADRSRFSRDLKASSVEYRVFKAGVERDPAKIDADTRGIMRAIARARDEHSKLVKDFSGASLKLGGAGLGALASTGSAGGIVAISSALTQVVGAAGLLPAAGAAGAVGIGTLTVAFEGMGEAMDSVGDPAAWAAALRDLSPEARAVAVAVKGMGGAAKDLRLSVQDSFFQGLADEVTALGGTYLPVLQKGLTATAREMNTGAKGFAEFLAGARTVEDVGTILDNTALAFREASPAGVAFGRILRDVTVTGSEFLPGLADGLGSVTARWADMVQQARQTGALREWMQDGVDTASDFGAVVGNILGTFGAVMSAGKAQGAGLLDTLRDITEEIERSAKSASGQAALGSFLQ